MRRSQISLMITLSALSSLGVGLLGPVYPIFILNRFSASMIDIGMLTAVFGLVSAFFKAPAGKLIDKYGEEKIFFIGVMLSAICSIAYIFAYTITQLYLIEFLFGLSYALQDPSRLALLMGMGGGKGRGLMIGIFESVYDVAGSIAALAAALIISHLGFELLFFLCSGCHMATGILVLKSNKYEI